MSQILDDCTAIQATLGDASTQLDQLSNKIAAQQAAVGPTTQEVAAVHDALIASQNIKAKITAMVAAP